MQIGDSMQYTFVDQRNFARFFTIVSAAGVVVIPFIGTMMDRVGFPTTAFVTVSCAVLWAALLLVKTHTALFVSFIFYSLFRTFFFTFLFAYLADVLGFKYFGVLAGVMFVLGGFLGLLQYPLAQWAAGTCHTSDDNPFISGCSHGKWESLNFVMLLSLLGTYYFCYTDYKNRKKYIMDSSRTNRANSGKSLEIFPVNNDYDESTTNLIGTKFSTFGNQNKSVYGSV